VSSKNEQNDVIRQLRGPSVAPASSRHSVEFRTRVGETPALPVRRHDWGVTKMTILKPGAEYRRSWHQSTKSRVELKSGSQAARSERLWEIVFQTDDTEVAVIVFVEFVAVLLATNSTEQPGHNQKNLTTKTRSHEDSHGQERGASLSSSCLCG